MNGAAVQGCVKKSGVRSLESGVWSLRINFTQFVDPEQRTTDNGQRTGEFDTKTRPKLNPEYDETLEYIPREERPEWNAVGLLGQLPLRKGQPVAPSWVKIRDISDEVELWLVKLALFMGRGFSRIFADSFSVAVGIDCRIPALGGNAPPASPIQTACGLSWAGWRGNHSPNGCGSLCTKHMALSYSPIRVHPRSSASY